MANHTNPIPDWLNENYVSTVLKKGLRATDVKVSAVEITPASVAGDNYCCQILRIKAVAEIDSQKKTFPIIGKVTPDTKVLGQLKEKVDVFDIEAKAFDSLFPKFKKYLKDANFLPDTYFVDFENKSIFMEDLKEGGYELQPRGKFLNLEQCLLTVEAIAKFHGTSWHALQEDPKLEQEYEKTFWDGTISDIMQKFIENAQCGIEKNIEKFGLNDDLKAKVLKFSEVVFGKALPNMARKKEEINVLLHGDCWMNNMLYHYGENQSPDAVRLLDFQIIYYGNIANDLNYFLFSSASADVLVNNRDQIIEHYYKTLVSVAPQIPGLTFEKVRKQFIDRHLFGYILVLSFRPFIASDAPADLEKILDGNKDIEAFANPNFTDDLERILTVIDQEVGLI